MGRRKKELLDELDEFERRGAALPDGGDFGAWLKGRLEKSEAWLARL